MRVCAFLAAGTKWGQSEGKVGTFLDDESDSITLSIPLSHCPALTPTCCALCRAIANAIGFERDGYPLGTNHQAAFIGLTVHHLDTLRTSWCDLVATALAVITWQRGSVGPGVSAPGATPCMPGLLCTRLHSATTSTRCALPGVIRWSAPAPWHGGRIFVISAPVDKFCSASNLLSAQKIGTVDKVCKRLISLNNTLNVQKVIHIAQ